MAKYYKNGAIKSFGCPVKNFKCRVSLLIDKEKSLYIFYQIDKNNQVCDCSRIGNVFNKIHNRVNDGHIVEYIVNEYLNIISSDEDLNLVTNNDEIISLTIA